MNIVRDNLFPTDVYIVDELIENNYLYKLKEFIINSKNDFRSRWQSQPKLFNEPLFEKFTNKILQFSKLVLDTKEVEFDAFEITDMWANILQPNTGHKAHTHPNNYFSGVFYVQSEEDVNIRFLDPRPGANVINPKSKNFNKYNSQEWSIGSKTNRVILFPSWLPHYVPTNMDKLRISISFNIMLKGYIGDSNIYTSGKLL